MNCKAIILLLAIVSAGGMGITSQAFGAGYGDYDAPYRYYDGDRDETGYSHGVHEKINERVLLFNTDSDTYDHESVISIDGLLNRDDTSSAVTIIVSGPMILIPNTVADEVSEFGVAAEIYTPMSIVYINQVPVSSDGSFSDTVNTASAMMKYDGDYKIKATYSTNDSHGLVNYFKYVTLVDGVEVSSFSTPWTMTGQEDEHHHEVVDLASEVDYSISGGHVESVSANVNGNSLVVSIHDAEDGGELTITLPGDVITPFNDGTFFVLVNDEESDDASQSGNTVTVPFDADATTIEIIGTHVVPEFGTIAAIILAVAITSIIVLSTKTKLNLVPKA